MEESIREVPLSQIELDPNQPRKDPGDLEELARSMDEHGLWQYPVVTPIGPDRYRLVLGSRRYLSAVRSGKPTMKVIIRPVEEPQRLFLQVVENLQREDLDPFELGDAYRRLMDEQELSEEELGAKLGKSQDHVSRMLTIAEHIPEELRDEFYATSRKTPPILLLQIARAKDPELQRRMCERASDGPYTVKQAQADRAGAGAKGGEASSPREKPLTIPMEEGTLLFQCAVKPTPEQALRMVDKAREYIQRRIKDRAALNDWLAVHGRGRR